MTKQRIAHIALVVDDYDDAIQFYTKKLNFNLIEDTRLSDSKRWCWLVRRAINNVAFCWPKRRMISNGHLSGNKRAVAYFFFCILMILSATIHKCGKEEFVLSGRQKKRHMGPSRSSKIYMVICGTCYSRATATGWSKFKRSRSAVSCI